MRILSLAVALFALAAFLVGLRAPDVGVFLYAAAALLCAGATYRSAHISTFLRVFEVVFAIETIVFGAAYLVDQLGWWPQAYADYALPSSLPLTVALFGSLVYAISHIPVVRKMTDIADPYFSERSLTTARIWPAPRFTTAQNKLALAALVFLIVINQFEVALLVRLNYFSRDFYNALQNKDEAAFWTQLLTIFLPFAMIYIAALSSNTSSLRTSSIAGDAGSPPITSAAGSAAARIIRWRSPARRPTTPTSASARTSTASFTAATTMPAPASSAIR